MFLGRNKADEGSIRRRFDAVLAQKSLKWGMVGREANKMALEIAHNRQAIKIKHS